MNTDVVEKLERENISLASFSKRIYAYCVDEVLISILFMAIYWDAFNTANTYEQVIALVSSLIWQLIVLKILYQTFFTWYYGASLGKMAFKIVCIDAQILDKPSFMASLSRAMMRVVGEACFYLGFAWAFGNEARQTWHDKIARTVVVDVL